MLKPNIEVLGKYLDSLKRKIELYCNFCKKLERNHRKIFENLSGFLKGFEECDCDRNIMIGLRYRMQENLWLFKVASKWSGIFTLKLASVQMCQKKVKYEGGLRENYNKNGNCGLGWESVKLAGEYVKNEEDELVEIEKGFLGDYCSVYSIESSDNGKNESSGSMKTEKHCFSRPPIPSYRLTNTVSDSRRSIRSLSSTTRLN